MTQRIFLIGLCLLMALGCDEAQAQATPSRRPYSLFLLAANERLEAPGVSPARGESLLQEPTTVPAPRSSYRRGTYFLAAGVGVLVGAVLTGAILGSQTPCGGSRQPALYGAGALAVLGLTFTFVGWGERTKAIVRTRFDWPEKYVGMSATALGSTAASFALGSVPVLMQCIASGH